ncbi:hypothetical protein [Xanthomonas sp. SI]|uniref:hypothetical protein n=1 Tax=Xanthomonas sp. SI TaxID=2724123 RepID=UPI00163A4524|nr:hypothetical protein [Xanthomonas sp. SI]QNH13094.1 hypothetical protein HEP75_02541 [Xanthomonas sp. SI]
MSRTLLQRLDAARRAFLGGGEVDARSVAAFAHSAIAGATVSRLADDEEGPRVAFHLGGNASLMWRQDTEARAEMERRIRAAWPELPKSEVQRVLAHIDARVHAALLRPSRGDDQQSHRPRGWVNDWRFDAHDAEAAR